MSQERPNIILILTDHWRHDCLSRLGHAVLETPHLDSLSRRGVTFTKAYSPSPSCCPARRCLMTGMTPNSAGMVGYTDFLPWEYEHTMAGELTKAGYQTINIGKTHFFPRRLHLGFEQVVFTSDFHQWFREQRGSRGGDYYAHGIPGNCSLARQHFVDEDLMEETFYVNQALRFTENRDPTRPYFMCLSFNGPHPPWTPPRYYYEKYMRRKMPPPVVGEWAQKFADFDGSVVDINTWCGKFPDHVLQESRAGYYAYLSYIDAQIGRLIERLRATDALSNSIVVFTSDHGEMLGDHHLWRKSYGLESSAHIPFIMTAPESVIPVSNVENNHLVGWEDVMPTFLHAAGATVPDTVEGRNLFEVTSGAPSSAWRHYYHGEHAASYHPDNANQYITDGRWKLIWNPITGEDLFFDLENDPGETMDRAADAGAAQELARMRLLLARHLAGRAEGMSDGANLVPGTRPCSVPGDLSTAFEKGY